MTHACPRFVVTCALVALGLESLQLQAGVWTETGQHRIYCWQQRKGKRAQDDRAQTTARFRRADAAIGVIVDSFVWTLFSTSPMTLRASAWYASAGYVSLGIVGAMAIYGFKTALGGRPVIERAAIRG